MPPSSSATTKDPSPGSTRSPSDDEDLTVVEPGFLTPPARAADDPLPPIPGPDGPVGESGDELVDELPPTSSTMAGGRSSPTSTELPGLEEIARTVVGVASMLVRAARSRRRELPPGVWIADEDDQAAIGDPLARIAARHAPVGSGPTGDMVDGLAVMVGATTYAIKGIAIEAELEQLAGATPDLGGPDQ